MSHKHSRWCTTLELMSELRISRTLLLKWASKYDWTDERIIDEHVPPLMDSFIREQHLKATHPEVYKLLCKLHPHDNEYDRWLGAVNWEIKKRGE